MNREIDREFIGDLGRVLRPQTNKPLYQLHRHVSLSSLSLGICGRWRSFPGVFLIVPPALRSINWWDRAQWIKWTHRMRGNRGLKNCSVLLGTTYACVSLRGASCLFFATLFYEFKGEVLCCRGKKHTGTDIGRTDCAQMQSGACFWVPFPSHSLILKYVFWGNWLLASLSLQSLVQF